MYLVKATFLALGLLGLMACAPSRPSPEEQARLNKTLYEAIAVGDANSCQRLISEGADVNAKDIEGMTPLISTAVTCRKNICGLLISKGADVNAQDDKGATALMAAASTAPILGNREMCEFLILNGADVNTRDNEGKTALMYAALMDHNDICELLRAHGAKE